MWVRALGDRAQGRAGLILVETLRTMTLSTLAELSKREEPATPEELSRLSLVLKRIEGTDKLRIERERAAAKAEKAAAKIAPGAGQAPPRKGLSPEAVAAIREVVEGRPPPPKRAVTSAPVDPWNPAESHLIPLNPGESRPGKCVGTCELLSPSSGGRSLRSLAYAPFGARRGRAAGPLRSGPCYGRRLVGCAVLPRAFRATFAWLRAKGASCARARGRATRSRAVRACGPALMLFEISRSSASPLGPVACSPAGRLGFETGHDGRWR